MNLTGCTLDKTWYDELDISTYLLSEFETAQKTYLQSLTDNELVHLRRKNYRKKKSAKQFNL